MKTLLILSLVLWTADAVIEWPFRVGYGGNFQMNITVGHPGQSISIDLEIYGTCYGGLWVSHNSFDPDKSSTFHSIKLLDHDLEEGILGTDDFIIKTAAGVNQVLRQKKFKISTSTYSCGFPPELSLRYSKEGLKNEFVDDILADEDEKVVVISYDTMPKHNGGNFSGTMIFGQKPMDSKYWTIAPAVGNNDHWRFSVDKLMVGDSAVIAESVTGVLLFYSPELSLPTNMYESTLRELNAFGKYVPCDSTKAITFVINGHEMHLSPEDYMNRLNRIGKYCYFHGTSTPLDEIEFPVIFFRNRYLMLDFEHKSVGFADKVK